MKRIKKTTTKPKKQESMKIKEKNTFQIQTWNKQIGDISTNK